MLLPIFSLPGKYGIGRMGEQARRFVDQLVESRQSIWQILPLGPTGFGDSPYSSFSTHAGNPYFIDLDRLVSAGLIDQSELDIDWGRDDGRVDYGLVHANNGLILRRAFERSDDLADPSFLEFCELNPWLGDYADYVVIKDAHGQQSWDHWPQPLRRRDPRALAEFRADHEREIAFEKWVQWVFFTQWNELHDYANSRGVKIFGDLPIYVSYDSADTWANPELFNLDDDLLPITVAGCPPDSFSATGQLWGNPIYDWAEHERTKFAWWVQRLSYQMRRVDILRIDHFRGLESYYEVPAGSEDARFGEWRKGPGMKFFAAVRAQLGDLPLVLEDLGYLTDEVEQLREQTGYPGMKPLQFAFDTREDADYLPHSFTKNCVCYTGTHDNDTLAGWLDGIRPKDLEMAKVYVNELGNDVERFCWSLITCAMTSVADTTIIPVADYLCLGSQARINTPASSENNWQWRLKDGELTDEVLARIATLVGVAERG